MLRRISIVKHWNPLFSTNILQFSTLIILLQKSYFLLIWVLPCIFLAHERNPCESNNFHKCTSCSVCMMPAFVRDNNMFSYTSCKTYVQKTHKCSSKARGTSLIKKCKRDPHFWQTFIASVKSKTKEETLQKVKVFQKTFVDVGRCSFNKDVWEKCR